jgi:hypothetical protein
MRKLSFAAAGASLMALAAHPAAAASLITYSDAAKFNSAARPSFSEDFSDGDLVAGLSISGENISLISGKLRQTLHPVSAPSTTFVFADPIRAFGGTYDFTPGGVGQKFDVIVSFLDPDREAVNLGAPAGGSGFFGFTSPYAVKQVVFQAKAGNESYSFDNLSFGPTLPTAPVPEPGTWALLILGFFGMGSALRRRRDEALAA